MNHSIDERLAKLAERHEALAQSLEILTHDVDGLKESVAGLRDAASIQQSTVNNLTLAVQGLLEITRHHEHRLQRLENPERPT